MGKNWDFLLSEFRRLGGIADNVIQKEGENGRGIFCVDSSQKARIVTPSNLLIKKDDIYMENNQLRIKKDKEYNQEIRNFFNFYQDNFSWGSGGKETTELFEKGLSSFNLNLKQLIKQYALVDIEERHKGKWNNVIKEQFLTARVFKFKNISVVAPILEPVNHNVRSLPFIVSEKSISTPNYPVINGELRHSYSNMSPLSRFFYQGFFSKESMVFSIPFSINIHNKDINMICKGNILQNDSMKIEKSDNKIMLEGLPIADVNHPRLPNDYFDEILRKIGLSDISQDLLLKIFQLNIDIREKIIKESLLVNNDVSKILIQIIHHENYLIKCNN